MSKSILVIKTPTSCFSCPLRLSRICDAGKFTFVKPESCPLTLMPEKRESKNIHPFYECYADGWNDCLDYITGDEE